MEAVRVRNPLSENTVVRLHPTQELILEITPDAGVVDVDYDSKFFFLDREVTDDSVTQFVFKQKFDLSNWSEISSMYLGEVFVLRENMYLSLCVILNSQSKPNILTVVNPLGCQLKLRPTQILEVVVFDPQFGSYVQWDVDATPGVHNIRYDEVKRAVVSASSFDPLTFLGESFVPYPRVQDAAVEHHFWFKCNIEAATIWPTGLYESGKITFTGKGPGDKILTNVINLNLRIKTKDRKIVKPILSYPIERRKHYYNSFLVPLCEDVAFEEKQSKKLWEGCRVLESDSRNPPNKTLVICDEYDD